MKKILAIETSCDDTSISILEGIEVISLKTFSQIKEHSKYGGVIPEMASRLHSKYIYKIIEEAMEDANINFYDLKEIYVTEGPGLVNTLQIGIIVAKTLSMCLNIPLYGINHIEAHAYSPFIGKELNEIPKEAIVLIVSGGHTQLLIKNNWKMKLLGETKDDSIGEAYDKIAKAYGKLYPGGPIIDEIAKKFDEKKLNIKAPITKLNNYNFSYSGLKSFMINKLKEKNICKEELLVAFQKSAIEQLYLKIEKASAEFNINNIIIGGGVSANSLLRSKLSNNINWDVYLPKLMYTGDNAAMIGYLGIIKNKLQLIKPSNLLLDANLKGEFYD